MKCLRGCWEPVFCCEESAEVLLLSKVVVVGELFCEGLSKESEVTKPNSLFLEGSS